MPRGSASAKRQHGASNHRDTRHENGLVGPGKRIPKQQRSQSHLNGNAQKSSQPSEDAAAAAAPAPSPQPPAVNGCAKTVAEMPAENKATESLRRTSLGGYSESSSAESYQSHLGPGGAEDNHRRIDVNAMKNANVHRDPGPFDFAFTVLRSCPLQDTIAILIILMQIPPLALSVIYMLFTLLTFVTTNESLSVHHILELNFTPRSPGAILFMDGLMLLLWLFSWGPLQHVILDLAQMVIALGLGGGSSSRNGSSVKNTLVCLSMILLSHTLRHTRMKFSLLGYILGSTRFMTPDLDDPLENLNPIRGYNKVESGWFGWVNGWVKSLLAIHILSQGLFKYVEEMLLRHQQRQQDTRGQNTADVEVGRTYATDNDPGFSTPDSDAASLQNASSLYTKKKKKHSAQVRNRQPLWAALASTKIVVVKEYELTHAAAESAGSNATDIHNLGNAPFNSQPGQIWISYVGCDEVCFNTSQFPIQPTGEDAQDAPGSDLIKPFYVRVNNAAWQPTRMAPVKDNEGQAGRGVRWSGDIYGLTPLAKYECEFVCTTTQEVLFSTSVRTTQAKSADVDTSGSKPGGQRSLRLDSPITTLKTSIAKSQLKLNDEKNRHKALRREFHKKTAHMRKDNEKQSAAVQSAGAGDDKLRQKIQQNTTQQKQAEQATASLEAELKEFEKVPEALKSSWKAKQSAWTNEKAKYDGAVAAFKSFKASVDSRIKALEDEKTTLQAKLAKISNRIVKVDGEHARIADANMRGLDEAERRRQWQDGFRSEISRMERELCDKIREVENLIHTTEQDNLALKTQLDAFHTQQQAAYPLSAYEYPEAAGPFSTPPGVHAQANQASGAPYDATAAWSNSLYQNSLQSSPWGPSPLAASFVPQMTPASQTQQNATKARGRSSSMLSDVSGFTQSSAAEEEWNNTVTAVAPPGPSRLPAVPPGFEYFHRHRPLSDGGGEAISDGSRSPSGGSAGSRDPMSPSPS